MALMAACGALVVLGALAVLRWGGSAYEEIDEGSVAGRYARSVTIAVAAGIGSGLLVAGPGGRLAMRLLAATAGDRAQGRLTEADEVVGEITVGGTVGFVVFVALFFGGSSGAIYVLVRRWLPRGRLGGVALGALLLVVVAPAVDPIRRDNPDFDVVGPGWLSLLVFTALALLQGMAVVAVAGRTSRGLPLPSMRRGVLWRYVPLLLLLPAAPVLLVLAAVGGLVVVASRVSALAGLPRRPATIAAGRVALVAAALASLPRFVTTVADIADRGPPWGGTG